MPAILFAEVRVSESRDRDHFLDPFNRNEYSIPVLGHPETTLLTLVKRVIVAVLRLNYPTFWIRANLDAQFPNTVLLKTSKELEWDGFVQPCLDDALRAFRTLRVLGLTESQCVEWIKQLGDVRKEKNRGLLGELLKPTERRIRFFRNEDGHTLVAIDSEKPDDKLIYNLVAWAIKLKKIGAYDAIFAVLDLLDLTMVGEFHVLSKGKLPPWQQHVVNCYRHLTKASFEELASRGWINFNDLIADLKTELIIGLCDAESGYYDPVMAAKVMLRQGRANPYSGEFATGDMVIDALIATGIPLDSLEQVLGRYNIEGSSEAHWWQKLKRRLKDPDGDVDRARPPQLGVSEDSLPRFSLHYVHKYYRERRIRLHNVAKSPIKEVVGYILQGLVKAVSPESITKVRAYEHEEKFLISFANGDVAQTLLAAAGAEAMFQSFANYGIAAGKVIAAEKVAEFFAGHRDNETRGLFSQDIVKLATPAKSRFGIAAHPDHFEYVDKGVENDDQRLERARHLIETIIHLVWFDLPGAARTLLPPLRSDLKALWDKTDRKPLDWDKLKFSELRGVLNDLIGSRQALEDEEPPLQEGRWRSARPRDRTA